MLEGTPRQSRAARVAIVSLASTFQKRAGNAAYLAAFCRALRRMGYTVEIFFLDPIQNGRILVRQYDDYLASVDAVSLRDAMRFGSHFLSRDPWAWAFALGRNARAALDRIRPAYAHRRAASDKIWDLPWPGEAALRWAERRLVAFRPDVVVANYFNASRVFQSLDPRCRKAILVHDVFALRQQSYAASDYPLDFHEGMVEAEAEGFAAADLCLTITREEADFIRHRHPGIGTAVFPFVIPIADGRRGELPGRRCLFVGSDNDPNRRALGWLLDEVWPRLREHHPPITLRIVGNLRRSVSLPPLPNVEFTGVVENLAAEYAAASVALVPLRAGSGLKVKLVEALAHGVPVVSTSVGAAGVDAPSVRFLRVHDDPAAFADAVVMLAGSAGWPERSSEALDFARASYSEAAAEAALRRVLDPVA